MKKLFSLKIHNLFVAIGAALVIKGEATVFPLKQLIEKLPDLKMISVHEVE